MATTLWSNGKLVFLNNKPLFGPPFDCCCGTCVCCNGGFTGATISVTGAVNPGADPLEEPCTGCEQLNTSFDAPATHDCGGLSDGQVYEITCDFSGEIEEVVVASWSVTCDDDGVWLEIGYNIGLGAGTDRVLVAGFGVPIDCTDIFGCINLDLGEQGVFSSCDVSDLQVCAEVY